MTCEKCGAEMYLPVAAYDMPLQRAIDEIVRATNEAKRLHRCAKVAVMAA